MRNVLIVLCLSMLIVLPGCGKKDESPQQVTEESPKIESTPVAGEEVGQSIHQAVEKGDKALVEKLLAGGSNVNAQDEGGNTPLHIAAQKGHLDIARLLIENGANIQAKNLFGFTPFQEAEQAKDEDMVQLFLSQGTDSSMQKLIELGQTDLAVARFNEAPEELTSLDENQRTPLHVAAKVGDRGIVELALASGADVNAADKNGLTPLMYAIDNDQLEIAIYLIEQGADINKKDESGRTALMFAVTKDNTDFVDTLLQRGAAVNIADTENGDTPLHYAAWSPNWAPEMAQLLVAAGAEVNAKNDSGMTPLDAAIESGNQELIGFLQVKKGTSTLEPPTAEQTKTADDSIEEATAGNVSSGTE